MEIGKSISVMSWWAESAQSGTKGNGPIRAYIALAASFELTSPLARRNANSSLLFAALTSFCITRFGKQRRKRFREKTLGVVGDVASCSAQEAADQKPSVPFCTGNGHRQILTLHWIISIIIGWSIRNGALIPLHTNIALIFHPFRPSSLLLLFLQSASKFVFSQLCDRQACALISRPFLLTDHKASGQECYYFYYLHNDKSGHHFVW